MSKIDEILETYGNYKTVRIDWAENEQDDPFEITDGNKLLLEQAKQAIYEALKAEMPSLSEHNARCTGQGTTDACECGANSYNYALDDITKALDKMFKEVSDE